jgi:hypothetical protein
MAKTWLHALILALWTLLAPAVALAQRVQGVFPCPKMTSGWALQWPPPLTSASYDMGTKLLYIVFNYTSVHAFANVPVGIIISLSYTQNPSAIYYGSILPAYEQVTLDPKTLCPVS